MTNKVVTDSWNYLRPATEKELLRTTVLSFKIQEASAKIRTGFANDDPGDKILQIWSGIIPLLRTTGVPVADAFSQDITLPNHINQMIIK